MVRCLIIYLSYPTMGSKWICFTSKVVQEAFVSPTPSYSFWISPHNKKTCFKTFRGLVFFCVVNPWALTEGEYKTHKILWEELWQKVSIQEHNQLSAVVSSLDNRQARYAIPQKDYLKEKLFWYSIYLHKPWGCKASLYGSLVCCQMLGLNPRHMAENIGLDYCTVRKCLVEWWNPLSR